MSYFKNTITNIIEKWWIVIIIWTLAIILFLANELKLILLSSYVSLILVCISLLLLICTAIYQFHKRLWLKAIITSTLFTGTMVGLLIYSALLFFIETIDGDKWANDLNIPDTISIESPLPENYNDPSWVGYDPKLADSISNRHITNTEFQLINSFQPGLYEFQFWSGKIDSGYIYIKAFEITHEYPLSVNSLNVSSRLNIYNPTDSIIKFKSSNYFTIYEGDWGHPYAARFEIWFNSTNGKKARKLISKKYIIEGWQR